MKRTRKVKPIPEPSSDDALALADALRAIVKGGGRGSLSTTATALAMTPSAFRKRLLRPGAGLDEASIKAVILITESRDSNYTDWQVYSSNRIGGYVITVRTKGTEQAITWRLAPQRKT